MFAGRRFRKFGGFAAAAVAGVLAVAPATVQAQEGAGPNTGKVAVSAGVDWTTHYFFRGIPQENQGLILQPYGELGFALYEGEGALSSLGLAVGTWHSFHDGPTKDASEGFGSDTDSWYEADVYVTLSAGLFESWAASVTYTLYTSPNDSFNTIADINLTLGYDDSAMWGNTGFALNPYVSVVFEVDDEADGGNSAFGATGTEEGTYFEAGIEPTFTLVESETMPVTLAIPAKVGLSLENYYEITTDSAGRIDDETFGFASIGVVLSVPLPISADYGAWSLSLGATAIWISDEMEAFGAGIGPDEFEVIGTLGVSMSY